jgi:2-polyprenyl-3-methyl-5-hydroxy-6-metoxy-1,4-benzoquinol methylase
MKEFVLRILDRLTHILGRVSGRYYFEDFVRVYPDGICINRLGRRRPASSNDVKNFLNHRKFYNFAAQFAGGAIVADIGCGSGYGCAQLKQAGARRVRGSDASKSAIRFARQHYGDVAEFSIQGITDMHLFSDRQFDLVVCSEVLEHIKEYGKEHQALTEIRRITRPDGLVVLGTPNSEMLGDHGFSFHEINTLIREHFSQYCIFENALVPIGSFKAEWDRRSAEGQTGVIVSQAIDLAETVLPDDGVVEIKAGIPAGVYQLGDLAIDISRLHNTHSWAIVART